MRAREFVEDPTLATTLNTVLRKDTPPQQPNRNANAVPQPPVASTGTQNPQKYSASGASTTTQNGVPTLPTTAQSAQGQTTGSTPNQPGGGQPVQDLSKIQDLKGKTIEIPGIKGKLTIGDPTNTAKGPGVEIKGDPRGSIATNFQVSLKDLAKPQP